MDRSRLRSDAVPPGRPALARRLGHWLGAISITLALAGVAAALSPEDPGWEELLHGYVVDPESNRDAVLALGKGGLDGLGSPALLLIADVHLRSGNYSEARKLLRRVIEQEEVGDESTAAGSMGHFGLAMIEVEGGDFADAYVEFARAASPSSEVGEWATLATAQAAAAIGKADEAQETLQSLTDTKDVQLQVREAALFSRAALHMRAGEGEKAASLLGEVASGSNPDLAAEALYAAARLSLQAGDRQDARTSLEEMLANCPVEPEETAEANDEAARERRRSMRRLRELEPSAILQAWVRNYRELPLNTYAGVGAPPFGFDGCALARATLVSLDEEPIPTPSEARATRALATAASPTVAPESEPSPPVAENEGRSGAPSMESESPLLWIGLLAAIVGVIAALYVLLRRS